MDKLRTKESMLVKLFGTVTAFVMLAGSSTVGVAQGISSNRGELQGRGTSCTTSL